MLKWKTAQKDGLSHWSVQKLASTAPGPTGMKENPQHVSDIEISLLRMDTGLKQPHQRKRQPTWLSKDKFAFMKDHTHP